MIIDNAESYRKQNTRIIRGLARWVFGIYPSFLILVEIFSMVGLVDVVGFGRLVVVVSLVGLVGESGSTETQFLVTKSINFPLFIVR